MGALIIGITGTKGAGKDTLASSLIRMGGKRGVDVRRVAFADKLKEICADLFGLTHLQLHGDMASKEAIDARWGMSAREILQKMGTEVGRSVHPDVWIRYVMRQIEDHPDAIWVISDVRFENEAAAIREVGGIIVRIERPSQGSAEFAGHASEVEGNRIAANHTIMNDMLLAGPNDVARAFDVWADMILNAL